MYFSSPVSAVTKMIDTSLVLSSSFNFLATVICNGLQNTHASVLRGTFQIGSEVRVTATVFAYYYCEGAIDVVIEGIATLMSAALCNAWLITLESFRAHHVRTFAQEIKPDVSLNFLSQSTKRIRGYASSKEGHPNVDVHEVCLGRRLFRRHISLVLFKWNGITSSSSDIEQRQ